ncbi:Uncharacterised protein [Mycobacteroides abscessus subsp. massiliense]|nr:Uncharacterised protein [Mycobacteroides abscessus subsp. massiliense]
MLTKPLPAVPAPRTATASATISSPTPTGASTRSPAISRGMPSPGYYHQVWHNGAEAAGQQLIADVASRLRERHVPVSTADLIAAQSLSEGLARLRGHPVRAPP